MKIELSQSFDIVKAADGATPSRTLSGVAVPWDTVGNASTGPVKFLRDSIPTDGPKPKLLRDHNVQNPIGLVTELVSTETELLFDAKVSTVPEGDIALALALDSVLDSVSVGVDVQEFSYDGDVLVVSKGIMRELSLLPFGAFEAAKVEKVAAAENEPEPEAELTDDETETETTNQEPTQESDNEMELEKVSVEATVPTFNMVAAAPRKVSAAQYISAVINGDSATVRAASGDSADVPGLLPTPVVLGVYDGLASYRPVISALGTMGMSSSGKNFIRPKITVRPTVNAPGEGVAFSSTPLEVDDIVLTKVLYGGFISESEQAIDWADVDLVNLYIEQLAKAYARQTESVVCGVLEAGVGSSETVADWTSAADVISAIYTAATDILANTGDMPTHLFASPDRFKDLAILESTSGDFLFPSLNPASAFGSLSAGSREGTPAGLKLVVSNEFSANTLVVGTANGVEVFEQTKGSISVAKPSTAQVEIAWRGYMVSHVIDSNKLVAITDAP
jgi:HK97 family phage major capsid protein